MTISGQNYYLLSNLPSLGGLGSQPPLEFFELKAALSFDPKLHDLVSVFATMEDLLLWEECRRGVESELKPLQLDFSQAVKGSLVPEGFGEYGSLDSVKTDDHEAIGALIWGSFLGYAAREAKRLSSSFLRAWVLMEGGLRQELARFRAERLGRVRGLRIDAELVGKIDSAALLAELGRADNPLEEIRAVEWFRWQWLLENDGWYSFTDDELAAYGAKLLLLRRWYRLESGADAGQKIWRSGNWIG